MGRERKGRKCLKDGENRMGRDRKKKKGERRLENGEDRSWKGWGGE